jgi:hypothetical protein
VAVLPTGGTVRLQYEGKFDFGLSDQKEEYTRGFRETAGVVSKEGVYLAGNGFWYPHAGPGLVEYEVEVKQPGGWHVISAGNGTSRAASGGARWESHGAVDEITVVGGPLVVYREAAGPVEALVYLRQKDEALASKYLQATAQYVEMYRGLIGPYPYGKFALVENFWETGYGMPSYTLLGPQVIRFPFISRLPPGRSPTGGNCLVTMLLETSRLTYLATTSSRSSGEEAKTTAGTRCRSTGATSATGGTFP